MGAEVDWSGTYKFDCIIGFSDPSSCSEASTTGMSEDGLAWAAQEQELLSEEAGSNANGAGKLGQEKQELSKARLDTRWKALEFGAQGTLRYRMLFFNDASSEISPWHDIPLFTGDGPAINFLCKTPRGQWVRYETVQEEPFNPMAVMKIKSGLWKGRPAHFVENCKWNLGMLPQTWADAKWARGEYGGLPSDNRPLEVVDISQRTSHTGEVYSVKPLAAFAVVEEFSRVVFKVITIAVDDPLAPMLENVEDVKKWLPGTLEAIREWLRTCTCIDVGDKENIFGMHERALSKWEASQLVTSAHASWKCLVTENPPTKKFTVPKLSAVSAESYELLWEKHYKDVSDSTVPLSDPHGRTLKYDKAWKDMEPAWTQQVGPAPALDDTRVIDGIHGEGLKSMIRPMNSLPPAQTGSFRNTKSVLSRIVSKVKELSPESLLAPPGSLTPPASSPLLAHVEDVPLSTSEHLSSGLSPTVSMSQRFPKAPDSPLATSRKVTKDAPQEPVPPALSNSLVLEPGQFRTDSFGSMKGLGRLRMPKWGGSVDRLKTDYAAQLQEDHEREERLQQERRDRAAQDAAIHAAMKANDLLDETISKELSQLLLQLAISTPIQMPPGASPRSKAGIGRRSEGSDGAPGHRASLPRAPQFRAYGSPKGRQIQVGGGDFLPGHGPPTPDSISRTRSSSRSGIGSYDLAALADQVLLESEQGSYSNGVMRQHSPGGSCDQALTGSGDMYPFRAASQAFSESFQHCRSSSSLSGSGDSTSYSLSRTASTQAGDFTSPTSSSGPQFDDAHELDRACKLPSGSGVVVIPSMSQKCFRKIDGHGLVTDPTQEGRNVWEEANGNYEALDINSPRNEVDSKKDMCSIAAGHSRRWSGGASRKPLTRA